MIRKFAAEFLGTAIVVFVAALPLRNPQGDTDCCQGCCGNCEQPSTEDTGLEHPPSKVASTGQFMDGLPTL